MFSDTWLNRNILAGIQNSHSSKNNTLISHNTKTTDRGSELLMILLQFTARKHCILSYTWMSLWHLHLPKHCLRPVHTAISLSMPRVVRALLVFIRRIYSIFGVKMWWLIGVYLLPPIAVGTSSLMISFFFFFYFIQLWTLWLGVTPTSHINNHFLNCEVSVSTCSGSVRSCSFSNFKCIAVLCGKTYQELMIFKGNWQPW